MPGASNLVAALRLLAYGRVQKAKPETAALTGQLGPSACSEVTGESPETRGEEYGWFIAP